jgi:hypothetical protein
MITLSLIIHNELIAVFIRLSDLVILFIETKFFIDIIPWDWLLDYGYATNLKKTRGTQLITLYHLIYRCFWKI